MAESIDDDLDLSLQNGSPPGLPSRAEQVSQMLEMQKTMEALQAQLMLYKTAVNTATALSNGGDPMVVILIKTPMITNDYLQNHQFLGKKKLRLPIRKKWCFYKG